VAFFTHLRAVWPESIVLEPRHASWFEADAESLARAFDVARVAVDPALNAAAARPGGGDSVAYWRLHGSPRTYYSTYDDTRLAALAARLESANETWCIFDNTAAGAAAANALTLQTLCGA
jgi:uncharacterized protein YecE (DUF72 family)